MDEEMIEKIKDLIARCSACNFVACEQCEINWTEVQAIRNLLNSYIDEKEKNRKLIENTFIDDDFKLYNTKTKTKVELNITKISKHIPIITIDDKIEDLKENDNGDNYSLTNVINILKDLKKNIMYKEVEFMNYKECLEWMAKEKAFLDTLDLEEFLIDHKEVHDIMQSIEDKYGKQYKEEPFIFNCMSSDEFMDYIKERYKDTYTFDESVDFYIRKI